MLEFLFFLTLILEVDINTDLFTMKHCFSGGFWCPGIWEIVASVSSDQNNFLPGNKKTRIQNFSSDPKLTVLVWRMFQCFNASY